MAFDVDLLVSTQFCCGNAGGEGLGACTLLGPEGPGRLLPFRGWLFLFLGPSVAFGCVPGVVGGSARTLRTTQWTRAS